MQCDYCIDGLQEQHDSLGLARLECRCGFRTAWAEPGDWISALAIRHVTGHVCTDLAAVLELQLLGRRKPWRDRYLKSSGEVAD